MAKRVCFILYIVVILAVFWGLLRGRVNIAFALALYSTLALLAVAFVSVLNTRGRFLKYGKETLLAATAIISTLFLADVILLYVVRPAHYLTYAEINGDRFYYSNALRQKFAAINEVYRSPYVHRWYNLKWKPGSVTNFKHTEFTYRNNYNSQGLRSDEIPVKKKSNEKRVIVLGDSFVEGIGAPQDSTGPALLQDILNAGLVSDTFYTVINAGLSGSDPFTEYYLLSNRLMAYRPDMVIVNINSTDIDDVVERGGFERFMPDSTVRIKDSPWWESFYGGSMIVRLLARNVMGYTVNLLKVKDVPMLQQNAIDELNHAIEAFEWLAAQHHFKLVFAFQPRLNELDANVNPLGQLVPMLEKKNNAGVADLYLAYGNYIREAKLSPRNYYWPIDLHHNSEGYLMWARMVKESFAYNGRYYRVNCIFE
ncbi:MAG TPA: hypothetical protein VK154_00580 [Chitinophagales bacterium]|nr:hypothetical protein [Chitinophagales bacterium]